MANDKMIFTFRINAPLAECNLMVQDPVPEPCCPKRQAGALSEASSSLSATPLDRRTNEAVITLIVVTREAITCARKANDAHDQVRWSDVWTQ